MLRVEIEETENNNNNNLGGDKEKNEKIELWKKKKLILKFII